MKDTASIVFTGDIGFDNYMNGKWEDENLLDESIMDFLQTADHVVANVEGPLSAMNKQIKENGVEKLMHTIDPQATTFLKRIGADIWSICNNHIMDAGAQGLLDTLNQARESDVKTIGAGMNIDEASAPVILKEAGGIGIFTVGYQRACRKADESTPGCLSWSDIPRIQAKINEIKKKCRWCIIVSHGGEEFTALPSPYVRDRYIEFLNMGADIVVGHHPHVPNNYELFQSKAIFYSLGNFVFDTDYQRSQFNTELGVLLKLKLSKTDFSFEAMGLLTDRNVERIVSHSLPDIFTPIQESDYTLLAPLNAKLLIAATKRQLIYLKPSEFCEDTEEDKWVANFYEPLRSGRVPGEILDFQILYPLSKEADNGKWKACGLEKVKDYILKQL